MFHIWTSPLGAKAQVTLPKAVRIALHLKEKRDLVGFIMEGNRVVLTRIEPVPSSNSLTEEEWKKVERLASEPPAIIFSSSKSSVNHLKKKLKKA